MPVALSLSMVLTAGCVFDEEADVGNDYSEIVGGTVATGDPAVVMLDLGGGLCTGTLVSPKVIVTAAHCLGGSPAAITAYFQENGQTLAAIPATAADTKAGTDIGAVALTQVGPVPPIPPNPNPLEGALGQPVRIVGYGVTSENGSDSGTKRQGMASLDQTLDPGEMITTNQPQGTCYGDSGGPNFMTFSGVEYVAGVTSRGTPGDPCGAGGDIAVRVDSHLAWLEGFIETNDPASCDADNRCVEGCATIDTDCCVEDGVCVEECGSVDPECGADPGDPNDPNDPNDPSDPNDPNDPGDPSDFDGSNLEGGCNSTGGSRLPVWFLLIGAVLLARRQRRELL